MKMDGSGETQEHKETANDEIPNLNSELSANENASSPDNVKNRVSSWLTEVVDEVRKKSAAVTIPKWTDNTAGAKRTSPSISERKAVQQEDLLQQSDANQAAKQSDELDSRDRIENPIDATTFEQNRADEPKLNHFAARIFGKFSFDKTNSNQYRTLPSTASNLGQTGKVFQFTKFGRSKINEIYEKVRLGKDKLPNMNQQRTATVMEEAMAIANHTKVESQKTEVADEAKSDEETKNDFHTEKVDGKRDENAIEEVCNSKGLEDHICDEKNANRSTAVSIPIVIDRQGNQLDDSLEYDKSSSYKKFHRNLKLRDLGRSKTLNPAHLSNNDDIKYDSPLNSTSLSSLEQDEICDIPSPIISTPTYKTKYLKFGGIGRSFSEQHPDTIDERDELLNERSHSCYQVLDNAQPSMMENNDTKRTNQATQMMPNSAGNGRRSVMSTSLPTFSTSSAMQLWKSPRKYDVSSGISHGADSSTSSTCMDVSPCGSGSGTCASDARELLLRRKSTLLRDNSYQSDSSHCSSVDSLLEARKPDAETILINLGFGPIDSEDILAKIPKRFLKPSQVRGIDTDAFLKRQQLMNSVHDHSVLGYRGLLGNPDIPPSHIVGKIMERFEQNERSRWNFCEYNRPQSAPPNSTEIQKFEYNAQNSF